MELILSAIYFILPAYVANMFPVIAAKLRFPFDVPISKKALGDHKTWRGFYAGYLGALLTLYIQQNANVNDIWLLNYEEINIFFYALLFGVGALIGDTLKSYFKRRLNKKPGTSWFPFDQLDLLFGSLLFLSPFYFPSIEVILVLVIVTPILHFITNLAAYKLGMKDVWW